MATVMRCLPTGSIRVSNEGETGSVGVAIIVFADGDPRYQRRPELGDNAGIALGHLRELFVGDEGEVTDPILGHTHHVSLKPWKDADPARTYLQFQFRLLPVAAKGEAS